MTTAPPCLVEARSLILQYLKPYGLSALAVGIVGDTAHVSSGNSYHLGTPQQRSGGYAGGGESPRDAAGLCGYASALDIGWFAYGAHSLRTFSVWLVAQCRANAADTRDIREVIYSPDGRVVKRWDREGRRSTGDDSHLSHTHVSFYRDATKAGRDLSAVFRRYLEEIGLIDMPLTAADRVAIWTHDLNDGPGTDPAYKVLNRAAADAAAARADVAALKTAVAKLGTPTPAAVDASAVATALAGNADFIAALAKAVNDDAARRMAQ